MRGGSTFEIMNQQKRIKKNEIQYMNGNTTAKDNKLKYKFVCIQKYIWKYNIRDLMMMNREKDRKQ